MHGAVNIRVTRNACIPDPIRLARYEKAPELGPRLLFFSGGTALNAFSRHLIRYTHNSIHIVTTFDSGGSSARLREAFRMPSVGDLRSRIMALADQTVKGNPEVVRLFALRLPRDASPDSLVRRLDDMVGGVDPLVADIPLPMRDLIRVQLDVFRRHMPPDFDLRGASIGNLILTGGYLNNGRDIDPVVFLFAKLVEARGIVIPVSREFLELGGELADGRRIIGQHRLTGKEVPPITAPIRRLFLCDPSRGHREVHAAAAPDLCHWIRQADLICFPMGSFYSSILVNLLPDGIAQAVRDAGCPKVYVPNTGHDPEQLGLSPAGSVKVLLEHLRRGCDAQTPDADLLNIVVLDSARGRYGGPIDASQIESSNLCVLDVPLVSESSAPAIDEQLLVPVLLSLA